MSMVNLHSGGEVPEDRIKIYGIVGALDGLRISETIHDVEGIQKGLKTIKNQLDGLEKTRSPFANQVIQILSENGCGTQQPPPIDSLKSAKESLFGLLQAA